MRLAVLVGIVTLAVGLSPRAIADIICVDDSATGANTGQSWPDAYTSLQNALAAARAGDEIRIAAGTYRPAEPNGNRAISFLMPLGVAIQGGYGGINAIDPDELDPIHFLTILTGDLNGDDPPGPDFSNDLENSYHVVVANAVTRSASLRGVTITGARAVTTGLPDTNDPHNRGGGLLCLSDASPTIENCIFFRNRAAYFGAGLDAGTGSPSVRDCQFRSNRLLASPIANGVGLRALGSALIERCVFEDNRDCCFTGSGGGLYASNITLSHCTFINNSVENGAAVYGTDLVLTDCNFIANQGADTLNLVGGRLERCRFVDNISIYSTLFARHPGSILTVDCEFLGNVGTLGNAIRNTGSLHIVGGRFAANSFDDQSPGPWAGGAILNLGQLTAVNVLFAGNRTHGNGGAIQLDATAQLNLVNCTIIGNHARGTPEQPGSAIHINSGHAHIANCIAWWNTSQTATGAAAQLRANREGGGRCTIEACQVEGWPGQPAGSDGAKSAGNHEISNASDEGCSPQASGVIPCVFANSGVPPLLANPAGPDGEFGSADDDPRPLPGSPCRDTGLTAALPQDLADLDSDGDLAEPCPLDVSHFRRVAGLAVDRGCFEFRPLCTTDLEPIHSACTYGDQHTNTADLLMVVQSWGTCPSLPRSCLADVAPENGDGEVGIEDLLAVFGAWGPCQAR